MDKYQEFFPNEKFPYEIRLYQFPEMYYVCNDSVKGDAFMHKLIKNASEKIDYYGNMKPKFFQYYEEDISEQMSLLRQMQLTARKYERIELKNELDALLNDYLKRYYTD
jgi:hypothetical protein